MKKLSAYLKSLNWKFLLILGFACFLLAIVNNLRVDSADSVEWIGSQPIMEKPE